MSAPVVSQQAQRLMLLIDTMPPHFDTTSQWRNRGFLKTAGKATQRQQTLKIIRYASRQYGESRMRQFAFYIALGMLLTACQQEDGGQTDLAQTANGGTSGAALMQDLNPLPGLQSSPPALMQRTTVSMQTTAGEVRIEVYPEAAPNAARRFVELVESGFYDDTPVSRVVPGFVAQFGVNWREPHKAWKDRNFDDDPTIFALERGTLAFAKAGPNTNSTQVFINYGENNRLADPRFNFTVFGKVIEGMDVVDSFVQVGDPSGGLDQQRLWQDGGAYLESLAVKPTMIERAAVIE
jgi:cyclophilin family peptidyl-prolyl cis-trans isomerase